MSSRSATTKVIVYSALLTAGLLIFLANRVGSHVRDWRDGLPGPAVAVSTGPAAPDPQSARANAVIAEDQRQLAADVGSPATDSRLIISDTNALIADLTGAVVPTAYRQVELRKALSLVRNRGCANCTSLLTAALAS